MDNNFRYGFLHFFRGVANGLIPLHVCLEEEAERREVDHAIEQKAYVFEPGFIDICPVLGFVDSGPKRSD
jgi:hypothetical protein